MSNGEKTGGGIFLAFLSGAAIGAAVGLLSAPSSGEELRTRISTTARRRADDAKRLPAAVHAAYTRASEAARDAFVEAYRAESAAPQGGGSDASPADAKGKNRTRQDRETT